MSNLKVSNLTDGTNSVSMQTVLKGTAKAWVNFNGTGTVAIRESFNVTSITDVGTGDYIANFTTPMPHVNYVAAGFATWTTTAAAGLISNDSAHSPTISAFPFRTNNSTSGAVTDVAHIHIIFMA